jgi:glycosyltransferase involved in cell wall biosynthesis
MTAHSKVSQFGKAASARPQPRVRRRPVLHLCFDLEADDPARGAVDLTLISQRSGWRAIIASAGGRLVHDAERAAVPHRTVPFTRPGFVNAWLCRNEVDTIIGKEHPCIIHAHGFEMLPFACSASRAHNLPLVADLTQPIADLKRGRRLLAHLIETHSLVRVPTEFMGRHLCDDLGLPMERVYHVPPGIDLQLFGAKPISAERLAAVARLWRLPEHGVVALLPLPLIPGAGHDVFLKALARVAKEESIFAVLIGNDRFAPGFRAEIEESVARLHLQGQVVMPEFCTDWPAAFWLASVVVAPNTAPRGENRTLLAAQAMGRPVIVTATGANAEMIKDGETGWTVPPDDAEALVDALREAIRLDTQQRLDLAEATRNFIASTFPHAEWFEEIVGMYETLLGARTDARSEGKAA